MHKKIGKYWFNFSALLMLSGLFALPFFSFAKYNAPVLSRDSESVLSATSQTKVFSNVVYSEVVEATFSQKERNRSFDPLTKIKNAENKSKEYRLVIKEVLENEQNTKEASKSFDAVSYFTVNGKETAVLNPNEVTDVVLEVDRKAEKRATKFLVLILSEN